MANSRSWHIVPKVLMFALYIIQCSAPSYLSLIYQQKIGLSSSSVGIISSIPPFVCIFAGPALSLVADLTGRPRVVLATSLIATTGTLWMFVFLELTFASACGVAVLYAITSAPIGSMMDVIVLTMLGEESVLYGQQRVWGSISCGIVSFAGGMIVDKTGTLNSIFFVHTIMCGVFLGLLTVVSKPWKNGRRRPSVKPKDVAEDLSKADIKRTAIVEDPDLTAEELREQFALPPDQTARSRRTSIVEAARRASRRASIAASLGIAPVTPEEPEKTGPTFGWLLAPNVLAFFFSNTLLGAVFSVIGSFLWIYLTNELDANATVRGLTGTAQVVLQLPFFFFAKQVMGRLGVRWSIIVAHVVTVIRFIAYPFLKPGPLVYAALGIEMLHGLAFSMNWTASVSYAAGVAPRGMEFMAQGILGAFYGGLGSGLGGIIGGVIYSKFGSTVLFYGCAGVTALSGVVYFVVPPRKMKMDRDQVPPMERVLDKQASNKLLDMEEGLGEVDRSAARRPSAVAMAMSSMGRRNSMMNV
ncbi:uncharacterized protein SPPG_05771 [Spizellomyces punctatus DAOM BR117]|uniref:Major facilitator superfamily associated domain-containing protein n=1 Tax=Spizellomyces punctatus (strain DAOM BR117) TaxID=645134 RepID=A0A0L0HCX4_SPIPD|nr:uncharacterized protein SPPG_05771 [Spizellomyces punctatus DAOM BR117]KNC98794.1 hypothetical protein SPPG_05771 [Spizellomyces punctatus DAOM BR117]|eukprot:XP_016606834.1 hypothetical protein SPPG_05771 [Spizellomyces punctatus DAOM BR117]